MGIVNIKFHPEIDVFDANISLGRRHSEKLKIDSLKDTLDSMDFSGIGKALAYNPHAMYFDGLDGNLILIEEIQNERARIEPQFIWSPGFDSINTAKDSTIIIINIIRN